MSGPRRLTDEQVIEMRRLRWAGATLRQLSRQFGLSKHNVSCACNGWTYKDIPLPPGPSVARRQRISVPRLRAMADLGMLQVEAAIAFGVSRAAICLAARRHGIVFRKGGPVMSATQVLVRIPSGGAHIRADTAEKLGIVAGEHLDWPTWQMAAQEDWTRNRAERNGRKWKAD